MRAFQGLIGAAVFCVSLAATGFAQNDSVIAFKNKLVFTDTPELGVKWRGGFRFFDVIPLGSTWLLATDGYINVNGWFLFDCMFGGTTGAFKPDSSNGSLTDNFSIITFKTAPLITLHSGSLTYKAGAGVKWYRETFLLRDSTGQASTMIDDVNEHAFSVFATQGMALAQHHYFNLFGSMAFYQNYYSTDTRIEMAWHIVPGYRFFMGRHCNLSFEYYLTNAQRFPLKTVQLLSLITQYNTASFVDNYNRNIFSYLMWGFSYARQNFRFDCYLAHHYTFSGPIIPLVGIGYNF